MLYLKAPECENVSFLSCANPVGGQPEVVLGGDSNLWTNVNHNESLWKAAVTPAPQLGLSVWAAE